MTDVRQELIDRGWKQGVILEPSLSEHHPSAIGLLVLNQTCDCINPCFLREPYLEVLPLKLRGTRKGKPDPDYQDGKNPREIHFWITLKGKQQCVEAKISEILLFDRSQHAEFTFSEDIQICKPSLDDLLKWRAARYLRPAFPDSFEEVFAPLKVMFNNLLTKDGGDKLIDSILIQLDHYDELESLDDCYELELRLLITPTVVGQPDEIQKVKNLAQALEELLNESNAFFEPKCIVAELEKMSLWESRSFLDFSRYDYLSFGQDE